MNERIQELKVCLRVNKAISRELNELTDSMEKLFQQIGERHKQIIETQLAAERELHKACKESGVEYDDGIPF